MFPTVLVLNNLLTSYHPGRDYSKITAPSITTEFHYLAEIMKNIYKPVFFQLHVFIIGGSI